MVGDGGFDEEFLFPKRILQLSGRRNLQVKLLQIDVPPSRAAGEQMQLVAVGLFRNFAFGNSDWRAIRHALAFQNFVFIANCALEKFSFLDAVSYAKLVATAALPCTPTAKDSL